MYREPHSHRVARLHDRYHQNCRVRIVRSSTVNVLLVSQCSKNALKETQRILDQYAERRGLRTWQAPITQAGLDTLRRLLRRTARKNTAVACHWIRARDHSELLWIVGDARRFNAAGAVPTDTTIRNVLRQG